jgi:hypothetical protein
MRSSLLSSFTDAVLRAAGEVAALLAGDADWPLTLFADVSGRLRVISVFDPAGLDEAGKDELAADVTARLADVPARAAALIVPAWRDDREPRQEILLVLSVDAAGASAVFAEVERSASSPRLGTWSAATVSVEGRLAEALVLGLKPPCPDCGTPVGATHARGCDVEICTVCGAQRLTCGCWGHNAPAAAWEGEWPGLAECRRRGWWARRDRVGWLPCGADEPGAREDLNRLAFFRQHGWDGHYELS